MVHRKEALDYHREGRPGKLEIQPTKPCFTARDLSLAYSPGVAEPCREIAQDVEDSFNYTARGNLVAVVSNGTAVLGLGDIGPEAAKPVMEGKAVLFKRFADIDCFDLEVREKDVDAFCRVVRALEPTFGGVNLEDIRAPECFLIEQRLSEEMDIPVFHDDQHGTAIITAAAFLNAMELSGKKPEDQRIVFSGAGAAAIACAKLLISLGADPSNILICDSKGVLTREREDEVNEFKRPFVRDTKLHTLAEAMDGADVFVGLSVKDLVTPEMLQGMASDPLVLAMANPDPEIDYDLARRTRPDAIVGTGRSDFPNQVNNVLGFPFIFRGALDVRARKINEEMKVAAVRALAELAQAEVPESVALAYGGRRFGFGPEYIIPKPMDPRVLTHVAPAVARAACDSGVARREIKDWDAYVEALEVRLGKEKEVLRFATNRARTRKTRIVFPEGDFPQVLRAASILREDRIAEPILIGKEPVVRGRIHEAGLDTLLRDVQVLDPETAPMSKEFVDEYYRLRQRKGVTRFEARRHLLWRTHFAAMMLRLGLADGMVAGVGSLFREMLRPVYRIVPMAKDSMHSAGVHLVLNKSELTFFADTTAVIEPTPEQLAETAWTTADLARRFDVEPRVAFLSFSTFGTGRVPETRRLQRALEIVRERRPDIVAEGEVQVDVALLPDFATEHYPFSRLGGKANVLIFPNLSAGNIAYKIAEFFGRGLVLGPFLTGLEKPIALLTKYSSVDHVLNSAVVTAMLAASPGMAQRTIKEQLDKVVR
ncbi:MAG: NADP-dependent malic enzyme [Planctomycetota bacterium]